MVQFDFLNNSGTVSDDKPTDSNKPIISLDMGFWLRKCCFIAMVCQPLKQYVHKLHPIYGDCGDGIKRQQMLANFKETNLVSTLTTSKNEF